VTAAVDTPVLIAVLKGARREQLGQINGGPREHLIPDFLIAAQAAAQADEIIAIDRGFIRRYFPKLNIVSV
jgi:predicted nucleic acid-binding protein